MRELVQRAAAWAIRRTQLDHHRTGTARRPITIPAPGAPRGAGEGGGVLLNQCPHNLDLVAVDLRHARHGGRPHAFGKWHDIEVEDDVTDLSCTYPKTGPPACS